MGAAGVLLLIVGVLLFSSTPLLTNVALQLAGAERLGRTADAFPTDSAARTFSTTGGTALRQTTITLGSYGQVTLPNLTTTATGASTTLTEADLLTICGTRCTRGSDRFRDVSIDLRPGGAVISADVNVGVWQRVGVAVRASAAGVTVLGVDAGGVLYDANTLPAELRDYVREVARVGSEALQQAVVNIGGVRYTVDELWMNDTTLTVVFRA
ncbi:MAG: hypothetical protein OHK0046_40920 [Anaerolineae bacterium]